MLPTSGITGSMADTVGVKNPYRYRGYRYDSETQLYYLQSRYYNPSWGRFVNADAIGGTVGELLSHNIFAYCANNAITRKDSNGYFWEEIKSFFQNTFQGKKRTNEVDGISAAAAVISGKNIPIDKNYTVRIDKPHVKNDQEHIHIMKNNEEVANQNDDGSPHHPNKNKPGEPTNRLKKKLKKEFGWDWDKKSEQYKAIQFHGNPMPVMPMPTFSPSPIGVPLNVPIVIFP